MADVEGDIEMEYSPPSASVPMDDAGVSGKGDEQYMMKKGREDYDFAPEVSINGLSKFWTSICRVEIGPAVLITAADKPEWGALAPFIALVDNTFRITDRGSTIYAEFIGGLTIFFTIAYIFTANPSILEGTGIPQNGSFFSSVLTSGVFTTVMGFVTNLPVVVGPSLSLNLYFREIAETCPLNPSGTINGIPCESWGKTTLPWTDALGAVYISGWFYLGMTFTGFRGYLYDSIPKSLRAAIAAGTGFFITMQGLKIGGITRVTVQPQYIENMITMANCQSDSTCNDPVNLGARWFNLGIAHFHNIPQARLAVLGIVIASVLEMYKYKGSLIVSIWAITLIGISYYRCRSTEETDDDYTNACVTDLHIWAGNPSKIPFLVDWSNNPAGRLSFKYASEGFFWQCVWTFLFFELFDSYGALEGIIARMALTEHHPTVSMDRVNRAMVVDGTGVWIGSIMGCNSLTVYIESNIGVEVGARTGLAAIVCGVLILLCLLFVWPFVAVIPPCATTCALVMIGVYSMLDYKKIDWSCYISRLTAFFTITLMGFTYSITNGICAGVIFYCWLQVVASIAKRVGWDVAEIRPGTKVELPHPFLLLLAVFMACRFAFLGQQ